MRMNIRVAGFGGQGVITLGYVLSRAVSIHDAKYSLMTQSYGPEARGGACRSDVIISDTPIDYPKLDKIDVLIALSMDAYNRYHQQVKKGGIMIIEKDLTRIETEMEGVKYFRISAVKEAEALGNRLTANMIILGAAQSILNMVSKEAIEKAVRERFPRYAEINITAVRRGMELGLAAIAEG